MAALCTTAQTKCIYTMLLYGFHIVYVITQMPFSKLHNAWSLNGHLEHICDVHL